MRFNIKNRPKWNKEFDLDELHSYASDSLEWFVGFEKELQNWYEICGNGCEYCEFEGKCLLKEILGDSGGE